MILGIFVFLVWQQYNSVRYCIFFGPTFSVYLLCSPSVYRWFLRRPHITTQTDSHTRTTFKPGQLRGRRRPPRKRHGQTDRKRESSRVRLRTNGELGQSAAQPLRDCLQLFQLRLLTPALLAQDLVLQPLVTLSKAQHTCSERRGPAHTAPASAGPRFQTSDSVSWRLGYVPQNEKRKRKKKTKIVMQEKAGICTRRASE